MTHLASGPKPALIPLQPLSRFQFVDDHRGAYGVKRLCRVLGVNRSSYYKWLDGAEARLMRERADEQLAARIRAVHGEAD